MFRYIGSSKPKPLNPPQGTVLSVSCSGELSTEWARAVSQGSAECPVAARAIPVGEVPFKAGYRGYVGLYRVYRGYLGLRVWGLGSSKIRGTFLVGSA